jgi:hypothetical protein
MPPLKVSLSKFRKYCDEQGGYDIIFGDGTVVVSFVPNFPEAIEKTNSIIPKVTLMGRTEGNDVIFERAETEDSEGRKIRNPEELELVYGGWLSFIEENY